MLYSKTMNIYEVYCRDEFNNRQTVKIKALTKADAKDRVLANHPTYKVETVFSQEEAKIANQE